MNDKEAHLFSWDDIPGNDNGRLIKFLKQKFDIEWVETAKIEKIDLDKTIKVSNEKNCILLKLNDNKTEVDLIIDDVISDKLDAITENGKLNIYEKNIFVIKTTANQERTVANLIEKVAKKENLAIHAILAPDELKGYILVEAAGPEVVDEAVQNVPHARTMVKGKSGFVEIAHFLTPKPTVTGITEGSIVELISGPFKGEKARVKRIDTTREEITVELFEAMVPIPVTVRGDNVRILKREEEEK